MASLLKRNKYRLQKYATGGSIGDPTGAFKDFIYGDWTEVGRTTDDAGVTTIQERRSGERDVEYSKRGVNWNVGYDRWLAAGNKGSLTDFKIEAERWKESQSRKETDVQNRERTIAADIAAGIEADKEAAKEANKEAGKKAGKKADGPKLLKKPVEGAESSAITSGGGEDVRDANRLYVNKWLDDLKAKVSGTGILPEEYDTVEEESGPGSGPPPRTLEPRTSINNTRYLDTESASTQGEENSHIEAFTDISDIKYPEGEGDDSKTTSVTTRTFKPKIFGEGLRRRGTETSLSETLNPDGTRKSYTYSTNRIKRYVKGGKVRLLKK
tara:strand:+ start:43 stop:1020 length:978 start_codon:yes stop_codon:yes gene_type:complete